MTAPKTPKPPKAVQLEPIPDYGDRMTWEQFAACVESGGFIDYDGTGDLATATACSNIVIRPSAVASFKRPAWATHVVWFNK